MPKKESSERQKKVINEMLTNGGSMKKAMMAAGYSEAYAKNPKQFRKSATFQQLLEENLPDWLLTEKHLELLDNKDKNVVLKAIQEAYKIKGRYNPEEIIHTVRDYQDLTDEELDKEIEKLEKNGK